MDKKFFIAHSGERFFDFSSADVPSPRGNSPRAARPTPVLLIGIAAISLALAVGLARQGEPFDGGELSRAVEVVAEAIGEARSESGEY